MSYNEESMQEGPLSFKVILLGDSNVGKTCFIRQFIDNQFFQRCKATCSVDFVTKTYQVDEFTVQLNVFDTAGQERFKSLTKSYFKGTDAALFMYSLEKSKQSFQNVATWVDFYEKQSQNRQVLKVLVGTKADLIEELPIKGEGEESSRRHKISREQVKQMIERYKFVFKFETSAKINKNINLVFEELSRNLIYNSIKRKKSANPIREQEWSVILKRDKQHLLKEEEKDKSCC